MPDSQRRYCATARCAGGARRVGAALILALVAVALVAGSPLALGQAPRLINEAPAGPPWALPAATVRSRRLPPVERPIQRVNHTEPIGPSSRRVRVAQATLPDELPAPREEIPPVPIEAPGTYPIDLPTALRLADANNLLVAAARARISVATARVDAANALWLPSIRGGTNYNRHDGAIQDVRGIQFNTTRGAMYAGLGSGIYGAGTPIVPGIYANFHLADALFVPLAARQFAGAANQAAIAETNDTLLEVSLGYFELLRAGEDLAIAEATRDDARQLTDITVAYAETGEGLTSDANRARTELALREVDVERSREAQRVASARLAQLLRLHPACLLLPADATVVPIDVMPTDVPLKELVAEGLLRRPELAEHRALVSEAVARLRREQWSVFLPNFILGASYGGMGAGVNTDWAAFHDRFDFDAVAYWELRNLGYGERAARREARATVWTKNYRYLAVVDQVAREVVEAYAQVQYRQRQIPLARHGIEVAYNSHVQNLARIQDGKGLPIEALQSIQALVDARRAYLRTLIDYNDAQFTLYRAIGWPVQLPWAVEAPAAQQPAAN
jgi:outer membrane protein TolC